MEVCKKCALKTSFTEPFWILVNNPKQLMHAGISLENKIFWKRIIKTPLKVNSIFSFAPSSFYGQNYGK